MYLCLNHLLVSIFSVRMSPKIHIAMIACTHRECWLCDVTSYLSYSDWCYSFDLWPFLISPDPHMAPEGELRPKTPSGYHTQDHCLIHSMWGVHFPLSTSLSKWCLLGYRWQSNTSVCCQILFLEEKVRLGPPTTLAIPHTWVHLGQLTTEEFFFYYSFDWKSHFVVTRHTMNTAFYENRRESQHQVYHMLSGVEANDVR